MNTKGKLIKHLPIQTGEGKKGTWQKGGFIIETTSGKFTKTIMFSTWGELVDSTKQITTGINVNVEFDLESREYNGKYFTDAKAWKVEGVDSTPTPVKKSNNNSDDLPF